MDKVVSRYVTMYLLLCRQAAGQTGEKEATGITIGWEAREKEEKK